MKRYVLVTLVGALGGGGVVAAVMRPPRTAATQAVTAASGESPAAHQAQQEQARAAVELMARIGSRIEQQPPPAAKAPPPAITVDQLHGEIGKLARSAGGVTGPGPAALRVVTEVKSLGKAGIQALQQEMSADDWQRRFTAAQLLGQLNAGDAVPTLLASALHDEDPKVAAAASQSLALMDDPGTLDSLKQIAASPNGPASEINAIFGLCKAGDADGIQRALQYLNDPEKSMEQKAVLAANLATLPQPMLLPVIDRAVALFETSPTPVMRVAIKYYTMLQTPDARQRLAMIATDPNVDPTLRSAAQAAVTQ